MMLMKLLSKHGAHHGELAPSLSVLVAAIGLLVDWGHEA